MKEQGVNTVKELLAVLENYPKDCMIALFDELQGFVGIGFKLEPVTIDNCQTKQIVLKQRENNQIYDVQAFIGYLHKFPIDAYILMRNQQGEPSPIYVCIDGDKKSQTKGRSLSHCVGGSNYLKDHSEGKTTIVFIRQANKPQEPYFTMEYRNKKIVQIQGKMNREEVPKAVRETANKWLKKANKI